MDEILARVLVLLGTTVVVVLVFQRLRLPTTLGYLLVGLLLGKFTGGPTIDAGQVDALAEFGIVFLLFTIGLNFSLPQIHALRHDVLGLGTGQVALTTAVVAIGAWIVGVPGAAAFVLGAVAAQSSTTVISKQLVEQGEEHSRHGRLGVALSVFQDVTAVPFLVVIPTLGAATGFNVVFVSLAVALSKAVAAFAIVVVVGRKLFRLLFSLVARWRSPEIFTLTVLFVALIAAWTTSLLGLSMSFGAFLAGMVLGETEFRHQVESSIRPFRDVLLGLFFVSIGMLVDPSTLPEVWHWGLLGVAVMFSVKSALVYALVRWRGIDPLTAWRTGLLLAVGGEFGLALIAIALPTGAISTEVGQIALTAVVFSIIVAPLLIRYNHTIARWLAAHDSTPTDLVSVPDGLAQNVRGHVIICGYGRIGQSVGHFAEAERIPYIALDLDPDTVRSAHLAGEPVYYGDASDRHVLESVGLETARLIVVSHDDIAAARLLLQHVRSVRPELPVMVRTRDEQHAEELRASGATEVIPETLEAGLMIASHALILLEVPLTRIVRRVEQQRMSRYRLLREYLQAGDELRARGGGQSAFGIRPVLLSPDSPVVGRTLAELSLDGVVVTALVREGERHLNPPRETELRVGDAVVLFGSPEQLLDAERMFTAA